jgi:Fic family protein
MRNLHIENESLTTDLDSLDDKGERVRSLMEKISKVDLGLFWSQLDISAIYHDRAIEGEVVSPDELSAAFDPRMISDVSRLALFTSLRNHRQAFIRQREFARRRDSVFTLEMFQSFHQLFSTREGDDGAEFRKDIPLHRTYFHEISPAASIEKDMADLIAWMNDPADRQDLHPVVWASRFHYRFMRVFPWPGTSGKIGRAFMNIYLLRNGYLPAIIHATDRQRYYETIRSSAPDLLQLIIESENSAFDSAIRFLRRVLPPRYQ